MTPTTGIASIDKTVEEAVEGAVAPAVPPAAASAPRGVSHFSGDDTIAGDSEEIAGQLTRGDRAFLLGAGILLLGLCAAHWALLSGFGLKEVEIDRLPERRFDFQVDINRANWVEWMQLPDIGEVTARKIVADREERGPFRSIGDVQRVSGIGPRTLAAMQPWLACSDCAEAENGKSSNGAEPTSAPAKQ